MPLAKTLLVLGAALLQAGGVRDVDGRSFAPFEPAHAPRILIFVSSDCPISNGYAPEVQRICREHRAGGVRCALVYEDAEIAAGAVRRHMADYGYEGFTAVVDRGAALARRAEASITPEAVLVDASGTIRYRGRIDNKYVDLGKPRRVVTEHDLRDAIAATLAGKPVAQPVTTALGCHISDQSRRTP